MSDKARPFLAWTRSDLIWKVLGLNEKRTYE
jgi:hypothetical protein